MWSLGCIMAQLLKSIYYDSPKTRPFFRGHSCFPLSPHASNGDGTLVSKKDLLCRMFTVLGPPSEDDMSFLSESDSLGYFESVIGSLDHCKKGLEATFPKANPQLLKLLKGLL